MTPPNCISLLALLTNLRWFAIIPTAQPSIRAQAGLDVLANDVKGGKIALVNSLMKLEKLNKSRPNSFLLRVFFDAKADEISDIFSDGPSVNMAKLASMLNKVAPMHSSKWKNIKF